MSATTADALRAGRTQIDTPEKWWQLTTGSGNGKNTCMVLALDVNPWDVREDARDALARVIVPGFDPTTGDGFDVVTTFNDAPERTHAEVLAVYDAAIADEEAKA